MSLNSCRCHGIQPPEWDASSIYQLVFGLVTIVIAVPGALMGYYVLRERRARRLEGQ